MFNSEKHIGHHISTLLAGGRRKVQEIEKKHTSNSISNSVSPIIIVRIPKYPHMWGKDKYRGKDFSIICFV